MASENIKAKGVMNDVGEFLDFNQLSEGCVCSVKVLICRKWDSISSYGKYLSTEYILSDDKGNAIQCSVRSNIAHCFVGKLVEGQIFSLRNFSLVPNKEKFRIRNTDRYIIELEGYTVVRKLECSSNGFERFPFQLAPFDAIELNDSCYLIDVIGYVVDVGMLKKTMKGSELLDCHIMNDRNARLRVTVWGSLCSDLIRRKGHSEHYVAIFTSMNVKEFRGELYLSSTSAIAIFDDNTIGHISSYLQIVREGKNPNMFTVEPEPATENGTLAKLLSVSKYLPTGTRSKSITVYCRVRFVNIHTKNGWFYYVCGLGGCKKNATPIGNKFWCETCKKEPEFPRTSYRIHVEVADESATAIITLFDNIAEELLKKTAAKLLSEVGDDADESVLPQAILDLANTSHTLEIMSHTYYRHKMYDKFTANKLIHSTVNKEAANQPSSNVVDSSGAMNQQSADTISKDDPSTQAAILSPRKQIPSTLTTEEPNTDSTPMVDGQSTKKRQRNGALKIEG